MQIQQLAAGGRGATGGSGSAGRRGPTGRRGSAERSGPTGGSGSAGLALLALAAMVALVSVGCFRLTHSLSVLNSNEVEIKATGLLDPEFFPLAEQLEQLEINTRRSLADDLNEERRRWSEHQDADRLLSYLDQISFGVSTSTDASGWIGVELSAVSPRVVPEGLVGIETRLFGRSVVPDLGNFLELGDVTMLSQTSNGWEFRLDLLGERELSLSDLSDLSELPEALSAFGTMAELLELTEGLGEANYPEVFFSVTLPGELERTTADDVVSQGGFTTASWQIFPLDNVLVFLGEGLVLETTVDEGGFPLWLLLVLVGLGILLLLVLVPRSLFRKLAAGWSAAAGTEVGAGSGTDSGSGSDGDGSGEASQVEGEHQTADGDSSAAELGMPEQEESVGMESGQVREQSSDHELDPG